MRYKYPVNIVIFLLVSMFMVGCVTQKMAKQAAGYERAGMFKEAAELYYQAAIKKPNKIDYKTGLKRSGQIYLEGLASDINHAFNRTDYKQVVYNYLEMEAFAAKAKKTGVDLRIEYTTQRTYQNAQQEYLNERYETGQKLIGEGNFDEAKRVFTEIHQINPDFKDTRSYLNTATLEPIYQNGARYFSQRNYMAAYNEWERVASKDPRYKDVRQRMQQALSERYKEGCLFLINEDFGAAAAALGDVYKVNPGYMDVKVQFIEARNEPVYRSANQNLFAGRCRTAFWGFEQILEDAGGNYKEAAKLRDRALQCASYPMAVHSNKIANNPGDGEEFENGLIQHILEAKDPFIKIYKLPALNRRIYRSFLGSSGSLNKSLLKNLHDNNGIKAVLVLNFSHYQKTSGPLEHIERTGFERVAFTDEGSQLAYRDRQVTYIEYWRKNQVSVNMNFQLISTQTGEILLSQRFSQAEEDNLHYAVYNGEVKNLYPAIVNNNSYHIDERNYSSLQRLLNADKQIIPAENLRDMLFADINENISSALINFNPEQ